MPDQRFQVDLRGLVEVFGSHLYGSPEVFVRELLQNAVDAVRARREFEPGFVGSVEFEWIDADGATLVVGDDGIGLTEAEVHRFLATLGASAKRGALPTPAEGYLGRFGIGLLSAFLVADEILVVSRSARPGVDSATVEWLGRYDGTYRARPLDRRAEPGTQVWLRLRPTAAERFPMDRVRALVERYAAFLDVAVTFVTAGRREPIERAAPPWRADLRAPATVRAAEAWCRSALGFAPLATLPLATADRRTRAVAFVLPAPTGPASRPAHRVHLRGLPLSDAVPEVLPPWAPFVQAVVDSEVLEPTAARDRVVENATLATVRRELGAALASHLLELAERDPALLRRLVAVHGRALQQLAVGDRAGFEALGPFLPVRTSLGQLTLEELVDLTGGDVRIATEADAFRAIRPVATAQGLCVVDGAAALDADLVARLPVLWPEAVVRRVTPTDLLERFDPVPAADRAAAERLAAAAAEHLRPSPRRVEVRCFEPVTLPMLWIADPDEVWRRALAEGAGANPFGDAVADFAAGEDDSGGLLLCLNLRCPLVGRLAACTDPVRIALGLRVLAAHARLSAGQPLEPAAASRLQADLLRLLELGLDAAGSA